MSRVIPCKSLLTGEEGKFFNCSREPIETGSQDYSDYFVNIEESSQEQQWQSLIAGEATPAKLSAFWRKA